MLLEKQVLEKTDSAASHEDEPLPATLTFVLSLGAFIAVVWFGMYMLLRARW